LPNDASSNGRGFPSARVETVGCGPWVVIEAIGGLITAPEVEVLGLVDALNIGTL
jgi:hypothetical protein